MNKPDSPALLPMQSISYLIEGQKTYRHYIMHINASVVGFDLYNL
jgi:hypothetical protein